MISGSSRLQWFVRARSGGKIIFAICGDLAGPTVTRLARTLQSTRTRRRPERCMPLVAFCLRHFSADFIICTCEFEFRQAQYWRLVDEMVFGKESKRAGKARDR